MEEQANYYKIIITMESLINFFDEFKHDLEFRICQVFYNTIMTYKENSEILKDVYGDINDLVYKDLHQKFEETMQDFNDKVLSNQSRYLADEFEDFIESYSQSTVCMNVEYEEHIVSPVYTFLVRSSAYTIDALVDDLQLFIEKLEEQSMESIDNEVPGCFSELLLDKALISSLLANKFNNQLTESSIDKISDAICESPEKFSLKVSGLTVESNSILYKVS